MLAVASLLILLIVIIGGLYGASRALSLSAAPATFRPLARAGYRR